MEQDRIRVAVVDDHRVFAEALASRLADEPDLAVIGTAASPWETMELFSRNEIDVVALDLDLNGEDGLAVGRQLRDQWPDLGIVVVTAVAADDARVAEALRIGVRGWVGKQSAIESLLAALRGAARGEAHLPAHLVTRVLELLSGKAAKLTPEAEAIALLTARELDVMRALMEGMSRSEIAKALHITPNTVRTHIQGILGKLNVHSTLTAVAHARRAGILGIQEAEAAKLLQESAGQSVHSESAHA